jgi:transcriptional regulator with XRE-family HTH domain
MARAKRPDAAVQASREAGRIAATLGADMRKTRRRRRLTQAALGARIGVGQGRISELELGHGASAPLDTWIALGLALDRPLAVAFSRDLAPDGPQDAGHLEGQEIVLRLGRVAGRRPAPELPTRPANPTLSIDVCQRDDAARVLIVNEIWNRCDDVGAAYRATARKLAEAQDLAVVLGGDDGPYRVAVCWVVLATDANRRLLRRFPEMFDSRFPGSSLAWARCLTQGSDPPVDPGVVWLDLRSGRISPRRRRS